MLLPKKRNYYIETVRSQYEHAHCKSDLDEAERVVKEMYPPYAEAFSKVMNRKKLHILNMFVMKKNLLIPIAPGFLRFFLSWKSGSI